MKTQTSNDTLRLIGIDTGGTFTDFVCFDGGRLKLHKELSTPAAPEQAIIAGLKALGVTLSEYALIHGSTVATNALLEGKGARTVFITNRGFADVLTIGRQARPALYDLTPLASTPPVAAELCLETGGRMDHTGATIEALTDEDLTDLAERVSQLAPEAVAISLLYAFVDGSHEQAIRAALPASGFVCCSHEVLPEQREYERGIATWLNAYTGPTMRRYLHRLRDQVSPAPVTVMQSSAATADVDYAADHAVNLLLSGPAGGLLGAQKIAADAGFERIMTFDMGGTSTDVALIDGELALTSEGHIGAYPLSVPMVDMHTIGAGGGSIARVDEGGLLHVGPQSAGADPGPACYGNGGLQPTVTDANVVLGRIPATVSLAGHMPVNIDAARRALDTLAAPLGGLSTAEVAAGIVALANDHMQQALRVISVERGIDPRQFTLVSFGGAGGLHVCALAEALQMTRAMVPAEAGVLSALGMIVARPGRRLSRTLNRSLAEIISLEDEINVLAETGLTALEAEGHLRASVLRKVSVDICYSGQAFTINLPWVDATQVAQAFHRAHQHRYGHQLERALELVNLRIALDVKRAPLNWQLRSGADQPLATSDAALPVLNRRAMKDGETRPGPLVISDTIGTSFVAPGWRVHLDAEHNLLLNREPG